MSKKFTKLLTIVISLVFTLSVLSSTALAYTFSCSNEDITAYVSNGTACHSGNMPYQGACAMHEDPEDPGNPMVNFGAHITLANPVPMYGGGTRSSFTVEDTGDYGHVYSDWWLDIWQGTGPKYGTIWNWCNNVFQVRVSSYSGYYNP